MIASRLACGVGMVAAAVVLSSSLYAQTSSCAVTGCSEQQVQTVSTDNTNSAQVVNKGATPLKNNTVGTNADEKPAPYILRIIKSGEGKPRSSNKNATGKQDNRRVDVTLTRKVPVDKIKPEVRRALFGSGGTVWLSEDPTSLDRILDIRSVATVALLDGELEAPITFDVTTNYAHFIDRLELLIWSANASPLQKPAVTQALSGVVGQQSYDWNGDLDSLGIVAGAEFEYAVRAYDKSGRFDQSFRRRIQFTDATDEGSSTLTVPPISIAVDTSETDGEYVELEQQGIVFSGTKVRLLGQDIGEGSRVTVNDEKIAVEADGRFGLEYLLPTGQHTFNVVMVDEQGKTIEKQLTADLDNQYFFMVALADLTAGENKVSGSMEPLAVDQHHYGGDIFVDGRLAFYLKGKVRGKYLVTAQMDTGTEDVSKLFDDFHRKDPRSVFRRLDPDQYYPVYGDDSSIIDDTDSQGKLYVRVNWDRSRAIWGNFNTNFTGTEFAPFNRSLYGMQLLHNSTENTNLGEVKQHLNVFASKAQSLFRHNEFLGTGGSLYYLRDTDIVAGSEKVWVEVRQSGSQRVVQKIPLVNGRDYDIDDFQGRLLLRRPLLSVAAQGGPSIIRDEPLLGNETYLVVDYEYSPQNFDFTDSSAGVRAKKWLGDHVAIGATWAHEKRDGDDYDIKGTDLTLKKSDQTFVKGEFAQSEASQTSGSFLSNDGGLSFDPFISNSANTEGKAFGIEARAALNDFIAGSRQHEIGAWAKRQHAGFSTANTDVGVNTTDMGLELLSHPTDNVALHARATRLHRKNDVTESSVSGQIDYRLSSQTSVSGELKNNRERNHVTNSHGESTLAAAKLSADVNSRLNVYGVQQATLDHSGSKERNNATSLGAAYKANDKVSLNMELSAGDKGNSALFGTEVNLSDTYSVYTNYTYSFNQSQVEKNTFVIGQRKTLSSQLKVYSEHQFSDEDSRYGYAHTIGLDQQFGQFTSMSLSAQRAAVENDDGTDTERNTVSAGLAYQREKTRIGSKVEYRWDEGPGIDTRQTVVTNRFEYRKSASFRWQGKLNGSITDDRRGNEDARFLEAGMGFAYRPVRHDRLNMLGRLTFLNDLQPLSQSLNTDQRSFVGSIEGLYDVTHTVSAGANLAHRTSEIRLNRNSGAWIDNDASLVSARLRYKARFGVDASAAYHWLHSAASAGTRHGALFSIGRRVGDNLTFSIGYNLTSFDDDLTNDDYDVKGWFVNLIGTY